MLKSISIYKDAYPYTLYFVHKVSCLDNCSDLLEDKNVLVIEITRTICSNSERSEQFLVAECFLSCSWRFLRSNKVEQLGFKLEKKYSDLEKVIVEKILNSQGYHMSA